MWCQPSYLNSILYCCLRCLLYRLLYCRQTSKSALHEAAQCGHADVVAEMLRRGADHDLALPVSHNGMFNCTRVFFALYSGP